MRETAVVARGRSSAGGAIPPSLRVGANGVAASIAVGLLGFVLYYSSLDDDFEHDRSVVGGALLLLGAVVSLFVFTVVLVVGWVTWRRERRSRQGMT